MKDIKVGFIGLGSRGIGLLRDVVLRQGEQVTAVCDTYEDRANEGAATALSSPLPGKAI